MGKMGKSVWYSLRKALVAIFHSFLASLLLFMEKERRWQEEWAQEKWIEGSAMPARIALDRVRTTDESICRRHMLISVWTLVWPSMALTFFWSSLSLQLRGPATMEKIILVCACTNVLWLHLCLRLPRILFPEASHTKTFQSTKDGLLLWIVSWNSRLCYQLLKDCNKYSIISGWVSNINLFKVLFQR